MAVAKTVSQVRIIGGRWRGRRIAFPERAQLRPTPDRVRETLFNWLQPVIAGAQCLDLFAGSGALGLEALSRGAARAVMVENDAAVIAALTATVAQLPAPEAEVRARDACDFLAQAATPFDVVFLDPPFAADLLPACFAALTRQQWIKPGGLIYIEAPASSPLALPAGWVLVRSKSAGQVGYHLARQL